MKTKSILEPLFSLPLKNRLLDVFKAICFPLIKKAPVKLWLDVGALNVERYFNSDLKLLYLIH